MDNFLFVDLAMTKGKPIDYMAVGTFTDMHRNKYSFTKADLQEYVSNSQAVIESTKTDSGEIVGLPIDKGGHDHKGGAGWITGLSLSDNRIVADVKWTDAGKNMIESGEMRFFSPAADPNKKILLGGSLTNWPASRDENYRHALRPIELSSPVMQLADESLDEKTMGVRDAFYKLYSVTSTPYVCEVYDGYVIIEEGDKKYKAGFTQTADGYAFDDRAAWVEVKETYVEAMLKKVKDFIYRSSAPVLELEQPKQKEKKMLDIVELQKDPEAMAKLTELVEARANTRVGELLELEQSKAHIAEFSARVTGGNTEMPRGLPVKKEALIDFLAALDKPLREKAEFLFTTIQKDGLIEFAEKGHGGKRSDLEELPKEYAAKLDSGEMELADLSAPVLALGDLSQYDLSKWKKENK